MLCLMTKGVLLGSIAGKHGVAGPGQTLALIGANHLKLFTGFDVLYIAGHGTYHQQKIKYKT